MIASTLKPIEVQFLKASKDLLKYEWARVKNGEATFVLTKRMSFVVVFASIAIGLISYIKSEDDANAILQRADMTKEIEILSAKSVLRIWHLTGRYSVELFWGKPEKGER